MRIDYCRLTIYTIYKRTHKTIAIKEAGEIPAQYRCREGLAPCNSHWANSLGRRMDAMIPEPEYLMRICITPVLSRVRKRTAGLFATLDKGLCFRMEDRVLVVSVNSL